MWNLKLNYVGIVGAIVAFVSLALPWWVMNFSGSFLGTSVSGQATVNLYQASASAMGTSVPISLNLWYGWTALAFVVIGALLSLAGSIITRRRKAFLAAGGVLVLLSIIVFAVGLQNQISSGSLSTGFPNVSLFSSGSFSYSSVTVNYSTYLTFGFWLALVAAIIMFVAIVIKSPYEMPPPEPSPAPPT